jgi:TfoX/Sxy family transcriptional regulator of competence genes
MAYNEHLAKRVRDFLSSKKKVEEKKMMGGLTFMLNDKMCVGIMKDNLMVRIAPEVYESSLEKRGCHIMDFTGRPLKGFVLVSPEGIKSKSDFEYWINLALDFNKRAKSYKKKK